MDGHPAQAGPVNGNEHTPEGATAGKPRILFVAEAVTLAHVARPAVLAQALDRDVYEVFFATASRYNELFPEMRRAVLFASNLDEFRMRGLAFLHDFEIVFFRTGMGFDC